jgi:hypothetical protein
MFAIANNFSSLVSILCWEIIYPISFTDGILNVHFSWFNFMLNFLRLSKVFARSKMSQSSQGYHYVGHGNDRWIPVRG